MTDATTAAGTHEEQIGRLFLRYPGAELTTPFLLAYCEALQDIDEEILAIAIAKAVRDPNRIRRNLDWPPSPDVIRRYLPRVTDASRPTCSRQVTRRSELVPAARQITPPNTDAEPRLLPMLRRARELRASLCGSFTGRRYASYLLACRELGYEPALFMAPAQVRDGELTLDAQRRGA